MQSDDGDDGDDFDSSNLSPSDDPEFVISSDEDNNLDNVSNENETEMYDYEEDDGVEVIGEKDKTDKEWVSIYLLKFNNITEYFCTLPHTFKHKYTCFFLGDSYG